MTIEQEAKQIITAAREEFIKRFSATEGRPPTRKELAAFRREFISLLKNMTKEPHGPKSTDSGDAGMQGDGPGSGR